MTAARGSSRPLLRGVFLVAGLVATVLAAAPPRVDAHDGGQSAAAQRIDGAQSAAAQRLTRQLVDLSARLETSVRKADRDAIVAALVGAAERRLTALAALAADEPQTVLALALPAAVRARLPLAVQAHLEEPAQLDGELEVLHEDWAGGGGRYHYFVRGLRGRLALHFAGRAPQEARTGDRVRVAGLKVKQALALATANMQTVAAAPTPATFGPQRTAVVLINFRDDTSKPYTLAQARDVIFTSTSGFFRENSFQQTWLVGNAYGWFTAQVSRTVCDYLGIAIDAQTALRAAGVEPLGFDRFVYVFPPNSGCAWVGLGTVGGSPSHAWLNGVLDLRVAGHELGHGLGLYHSHALECGTVTIAAACTRVEYGDTLDIMGGDAGHFNAFQKEWLGWLDFGQSPPITTISSSGQYTIDAYESPSTGPKALKIPAGLGQWLYVEYRQPLGYDAFLAGNTNVERGVVLHLGVEIDRDSSYLLDLTPATTSWRDPALGVGQSFSAFGATVTLASTNGANATVVVSLGSGNCGRAVPTIAVTPKQNTAAAGMGVTYTTTVTNKDTAACPASTFVPTVLVPVGFVLAVPPATITLAPGASASATFVVTAAAAATSGEYSISTSVVNSAAPNYVASASATFVVTPAGGNSAPGTPGHVSDSFDRASSTVLGNGWTEIEGDLLIAGGELRNAATRGLHRAALLGLSGAAQTVVADLASTDNNAGPKLGVMLRYQDAQNYYAAYRQAGGSSVVRIVKVVKGQETVLKSVAIANPGREVSWRLTATASGNTLTVSVGSARASATDSTFASGSVGILMGSTAAGNQAARSHRAASFDATAQ